MPVFFFKIHVQTRKFSLDAGLFEKTLEGARVARSGDSSFGLEHTDESNSSSDASSLRQKRGFGSFFGDDLAAAADAVPAEGMGTSFLTSEVIFAAVGAAVAEEVIVAVGDSDLLLTRCNNWTRRQGMAQVFMQRNHKINFTSSKMMRKT